MSTNFITVKKAISLMLMMAFLITSVVGGSITAYADTPDSENVTVYNNDNENDQSDYQDEQNGQGEEPIVPPDPNPTPPTSEPTGRLLLTKRAFGTGQPLPGAVFELRNPLDESLVATLITDQFGEASIEVPASDYFLREIEAPQGFILNPNRISVRIQADRVNEVNVTNMPIPATPEPPGSQQGRLLVTVRSARTQNQGTGGANQNQGALLPGAVFELRHALDNTLVAELVSGQFGEAAANLPIGDYFLRQTEAPRGYRLNPERIGVRISDGGITEINVTNNPIEDDSPQPSPSPPAQEKEQPPDSPGRLLVTLRAQSAGSRQQSTGEPIMGALFEVRGTFDDRLIAQLVTNQFGEVSADLIVGDYYLRQLTAPQGFIPNNDRLNFRIMSGEFRSITITNAIADADEDEGEDESGAPGRLLITILSSATGERLPGAAITVHNIMTDTLVAELTTDIFGEASVFLPPGRYFMRQYSLPPGFLLNMDRVPITINSGDMTDFSIVTRAIPLEFVPTPTPVPFATQSIPNTSSAARPEVMPGEPDDSLDGLGRLEIITRAAQSGNPLSGGVFAVYRASDNRRVSELTVGTGGTVYIELSPGAYFLQELRPTFGFLIEPGRILFEVEKNGVVIVEITKERDPSIQDIDAEGMIWIPPTGEDMSLFHYIGGAFLLMMSAACGFLIIFPRAMREKWQRNSNSAAF